MSQQLDHESGCIGFGSNQFLDHPETALALANRHKALKVVFAATQQYENLPKTPRMKEVTEQQARGGEGSVQQEQLNSFDDLVQRFSLFSASSPQCSTQIGPGGSLYCNCEGCGQWRAFVEGRAPDGEEPQYEVFTREHVKGLAHYLLQRAEKYNLSEMSVLEVGAGSGRLSHHLSTFLSQSSPSAAPHGRVVRLTATDSGERGLNGPNVGKKDALEAISEAMPHVVLASWMPIGVDWTAKMRATPSVLEYILIGETDNGICGDPWLTWGYTEEADNSSDSSSEDAAGPDTCDGLLRANSFSNYGPGRPVIVMDAGGSPAQSCSSVEQSCPPAAVGFEGRDEEAFGGSAQNHKRLKFGSESLHRGSNCEQLSAAIATPISPLPLRWIEDSHESAGLLVISERKCRNGSDVPPFAVDGWVRTELAYLSSFQICRTDERWSTIHHSHTVAFRRCIPNTCQDHINSGFA